jgi:hypothetical protein
MRLLEAIALASLLAVTACGGSPTNVDGPTATPDAAADVAEDTSTPPRDGGVVDGSPVDSSSPADSSSLADSFAPAPHGAPVIVPFNQGAVLAAVQIVTITWAGDPSESDLWTFDAWIGTSAYFTGALAEYNVGAGKQVATWSVTTAPPAMLDDSAVEGFLQAAIAAGHIPAPNANTLYDIYPSPQTTVTQTIGSQVYTGCVDFQAYHSWAQDNSGLVYAINPRCHAQGVSDLDYVTLASSHEIAEASTDPVGTGWSITDPTQSELYGGEIGDLCIAHPLTEDTHTVTALYSDKAAKADQRSCVPAPPGPNFGATANPQLLTGTAGSTVTTTLTVYSTAPLSTPLGVTAFAADPHAVVTGAPASVSNGDTFKLSVDLTGVAPGFSVVYVDLATATNDYSVLVPFGINVK